MPIGYDYETGGIAFISDTCEDCGEPLYFSGCDAPGCTGFGCQDCGTGCDLDFAGDDGTCAMAIAEEDQDDRDERINAERAVFGLPPIVGQPHVEQAEPDEKRPFTMDDYREQMQAAGIVKLNKKTGHKLRLLAIDTRNCATDYSMNSIDEKWQTCAGQLDRAADLLSEAARILDTALVRDGES